MTGERYHLVDIRLDLGTEHVRTGVVYGADEIAEQLGAEAALHLMSGWQVTIGEDAIVCRKGDMVRVVTARKYGPMDVVA